MDFYYLVCFEWDKDTFVEGTNPPKSMSNVLHIVVEKYTFISLKTQRKKFSEHL